MSLNGFSAGQRGSASMWTVTILAALVIIGISVYIAASRLQGQSPPLPEKQRQELAVKKLPAPEVWPEITSPSIPGPAPVPALSAESVQNKDEAGPARLQLDRLAGTLKLHVPFLERRDKIPLDHTCFLQNESPAMSWNSAPSGTQSYVVFLEKRVGGETFVNWIVYNIPANQSGLSGGQSRNGFLQGGAVHAASDFGNTGYNGPCEPKGTFAYALRVFALDKVLEAEAGISKDRLIRAMNGHIIDAAERQFIHYKLM